MPGTDQNTLRALRRDPTSADAFPHDVRELQAYLRGESLIPGVDAIPGKGTNVPLYILGSSLFGAQLAAALGLPYAFASHFAPDALRQAVALYREQFRPSEQLQEPYVIAGVNVIAADDETEAQPCTASSPLNPLRALLASHGLTGAANAPNPRASSTARTRAVWHAARTATPNPNGQRVNRPGAAAATNTSAWKSVTMTSRVRAAAVTRSTHR